MAKMAGRMLMPMMYWLARKMVPGRSVLPSRQLEHALTVVELMLVLLIMGIMGALISSKSSALNFWRDEAALRHLSETISFLHNQAIADQSFYRMEIDLKHNRYSVGILKSNQVGSQLQALTANTMGNLSLELSAFLNPALGTEQDLIPPPGFPSLAQPTNLPTDVFFLDVRTMRGKKTDANQKASILFSPRGFSEFAVIHLQMSNNEPVTLLVNPFTGLTEIIHEYKDFEWTYGKERAKN